MEATTETATEYASALRHVRTELGAAESLDTFRHDRGAESDLARRTAALLLTEGTCSEGCATCHALGTSNVRTVVASVLAAEYMAMERESMADYWKGSGRVMAAGIDLSVPSEPTRPHARKGRDYVLDDYCQQERYASLCSDVSLASA